jgi:phage-related protein
VANFNAGAIEATLTLDRSAFTRDLKDAQAQAKAFEKNKIKLGIELDYAAEFARLEQMMQKVDGSTLNIGVDIDGQDEIDALVAQLDAIRDETVSVEVDVDGLDDVLELEAALSGLHNQNVKVNVNTDEDATSRILSSSRALNGMRFAIAGIAAILPAFSPAVAGATAALGALGGAAGIVAVGLGAWALVAIPALKGLKAALKDAKGDITKLPPEMQKLALAQDRLKDSQAALSKTLNVYPVLASGYDLIANALTKMTPVISVVNGAIGHLLYLLDEWVKSPAFTDVVAFIQAEFTPTFFGLVGILGNLIQTIGYIIRAFQPFTKEFLGGLVAITQGWENWAKSLSTSAKFQKFLDYVRETGPKVAALFVSVGAALINIGEALAPLGGPVLDVLIGFFQFIAGVEPGILGGVLVGVASAVVLFQAWTAAVALLNLVMAANPIALVVIAIAALVAGLIYAYKNSETFRNIVNGVWNSIKTVIGAVVGFITGTIVPALVGAWNAVIGAIQAVGSFFATVWNGISAVVSAVVGFIVGFVVGQFNVFKSIVTAIFNGLLSWWQSFWGLFGGVITAAFGLIKAIFNLAAATWNLIITTVMNVIKKIVTTTWNAIVSTVTTVSNTIKSVLNAAWNAIKSVASAGWSAIKKVIIDPFVSVKDKVSSVISEIKNILSPAWTAIKNTASDAWASLKKAISDKLTGVKTDVKSAIDGIKGFFSGAGSWLYDAGVNIIRGLLNGIESMINSVTSKLNSLTEKIKNAKGPEEYDKRMLKPAGQWIIGGLMDGIDAMTGPLLDQLGGITEMIPNSINLNDVALVPPAGGVGGAATALAAQPMTKEDFMSSMVELIEEIRKNTQPLIGEYNDAHKPAAEIAEEWWFTTKGRGL